MAYNKTTKTLSSQGGVSTQEVSACLGVSTQDIGTLCTSPKISMWSRHKPVKLPGLGPVSNAQKRAINYGLKLPLAAQGAISHFKDVIGHSEYAWTYDRPIGGLESPYRLADFVSIDNPGEGYNQNCQFPPFYAGELSYSTVYPPNGDLVRNPYSAGQNGAIQYSDLGMYEDWYIGIAVDVVSKYDHKHYWYYKTSDSPLVNAPMISFSKSDAEALLIQGEGDYPFYLFLARKKGDKTLKNVLHLYNTTASGHDHDDNEFKPMLFDDISQTQGMIHLSGSSSSGTATITANIDSAVAADTSGGTPFPHDVSPYTRPLSSDDEWDYSGDYPVKRPDSYTSQFYMGVSNTLSLKVTMYNSATSAASVSVGGSEPLRVRITSGLSGSIGTATPLVLTPSSVTDAEYRSGSPYTPLSTITIPANGSTQFIINLPAGAALMNNNGAYDPNIAVGDRAYFRATLMKGDAALASISIRIQRLQ